MSLLFRPLVAGAVASAHLVTDVTWNPSDKNSAITLSAANMTATTSGGGYAYVRANTGHATAGKWYCEFVAGSINTGSHTPWFGAATLSAAITGTVFNGSTTGYAVQENGTVQNTFASYAGFGAGDVTQVAWDAGGGKLWFGKNNTWYTGSPAAGTSPLFSSLSGAWFPAAALGGACSITLRAKASAFSYSPPSGFNAWQS